MSSASTGEPAIVTDILTAMRGLGPVTELTPRVFVRQGATAEQAARGARELLGLEVDVIVAVFTPAARAAADATQRVPIVMWGVADPLGTGLVPSLSVPGGNLTGTASMATELVSKNLELLREWVPAARRVEVFTHATDPWAPFFLAELEGAAVRLGFTLRVRTAAGEPAYLRWEQDGGPKATDALVVQPSLPQESAARLALRHRLPACSLSRGFVRAGGLFAHVPNLDEMTRNVARYVLRVLDGEAPGRLPILQPTRFELLVNVATAATLGIGLPAAVRLRATEVIQ